jgi:2,4-dienoyl-CoA reductase-like NADH-dependent reductase (Old Yellow Enzyme family)
MSMISPLFTRQRLNGMWLKNRFVRSPTYEALASPSGAVTPALTQLYTDLADGELSLVLTSCTLVDPHGRHHPTMLSLLSPEAQTSLGRLASDVHRHHSHFGVQLVHAGPAAKTAYSSLPVETPDAMSAADIERVIGSFVSAAQTSYSVGADVVELHASGAYLLASFLSPKTNHRNDGYGGSQTKRTEILRQIVSGIRAVALPTAPLLVKVNGIADGPAGLTVEEAAEVAAIARGAGVDGIEVLGGIVAKGKAGPRNHVRAIRKATDAVVIASGGFLSIEDMEKAVFGDKICDLISLSRPLIRQPDLVRLFKEGRTRQADCISCNGCLKWTSIGEKPLKCVAKK